MLQNIRDKSQGWLAWLIVLVLCGTFILWGIHAYMTETMSGDANVAAYVNKKPIAQTSLDAAYARLRQQQQFQLGSNFSLNQKTEQNLKHQALMQLIISHVLVRAAERAGYRVTTDQVDEALLRIPAFQVNGQFSVDRFHEVINSVLYTQPQFLADLRQNMLVNQVRGGYINSEFALPNEVTTAVQLINQQRNISYFILPVSRFVPQVKITPAQVEQYYQQNQQAFQSPEKVSIEYIELSLPAIEKTLHFDQTKLQQYYEDNIANYTTPERWHVAHISIYLSANATHAQVQAAREKAATVEQAIDAGKDFSQLAQQYSDNKATAAKGGVLPWFSAGSLDPVFEKAAASLRVGQVSAPIRTPQGFEIIKLLDVQKAQVQPFDKVKAAVQNALASQQAQQIFADQSDKLSNLTYANPNTLTIAAKALNLPIQTTDLFGHEGEKTGMASNPRVLAATFSNDVLQQGNNSNLIALDQNTAIVLRIKDHQAATLLPFATVKNQIETQLEKQQAQQQAKVEGEKLVAQLQQEKTSLIDVAKQQKLSWQAEDNAGRYDTRIDAPILAQAFHMPTPSAQHPSVSGLPLASGDYAVISVDAVHPGSLGGDAIQKRIFAEQIENNLGQIDYELYVNQLMNAAKIKMIKGQGDSSS